jgi:hypothetical protein
MAAAMRASRTAERKVIDKSFDYQSALARGDTKGAAAAKAALRQAWEVDVRRKGGRPEDFVPGYPHYNIAPVQTGFFGDASDTESKISKIIVRFVILSAASFTSVASVEKYMALREEEVFLWKNMWPGPILFCVALGIMGTAMATFLDPRVEKLIESTLEKVNKDE